LTRWGQRGGETRDGHSCSTSCSHADVKHCTSVLRGRGSCIAVFGQLKLTRRRSEISACALIRVMSCCSHRAGSVLFAPRRLRSPPSTAADRPFVCLAMGESLLDGGTSVSAQLTRQGLGLQVMGTRSGEVFGLVRAQCARAIGPAFAQFGLLHPGTDAQQDSSLARLQPWHYRSVSAGEGAGRVHAGCLVGEPGTRPGQIR
jgi:hypothetical protein